MKKSIFLLFLLIVALGIQPNFIALNNQEEKYVSTNFKIYKSYSLLQENKTIPIVNITLTNGTKFGFTTVDDAVKFLYNNLINETITQDEIENITVVPLTTYLKAVEGEINITSSDIIPGYQAFFVKKGPLKNYSGLYIPTNEKDAFINKANLLTRSLLYGKIGEIIITDIDGNKRSIRQAEFSLIIFLNTTEGDVAEFQLHEIKKNFGLLLNKSVEIYIIDISNNQSALAEFKALINITGIIFALDSNITIDDTTIESLYKKLGFVEVTPSSAIFSSNGFLLRKDFGVVNITEISDIIDVLRIGVLGLVKHIVTAIYLEKPVEGTTTDMVIVLKDGFGEIESLIGEYKTVYKNGTVSEPKKATFTTSDGKVYRFTLLIPNDTIQLIWNITIKTDFYSESLSVTLSIKEVGEEKREGRQTVYWIAAFIALLIIAFVGYRKLKE